MMGNRTDAQGRQLPPWQQPEAIAAAERGRTAPDEDQFFVAMIDKHYRIIAVGRTIEEARNAAADLYISRRNRPMLDLRTREAVFDYYGVNAYGPMAIGKGWQE